MTHRRVAVMVSAVLLLTACTDVVTGVASPGGPASRSTPPSGGSAPAPSPTDPTDEQSPEDPADTEADGGPAQPGSGEDDVGMRVEGVHFRNENGDVRLVVNLSSSGVPEWTIGYSEASGPGGEPVDIAGDAFLRLRLRTGSEPSGRSTTNVRSSPGPIAQVLTTGYHEGTEEVLIGVRGGELPFRAFAQTDPGRIVIDVPEPADG
ncbi:hypothetical protein E4P40_06200 [Blastococcus sp. CT_GayMR20]|uniref:AMIN-like domain-containing (lipo)protein n=1 Tax=Blastococcus sp. CT_GayMR20 TaxID=2559609 RepID=UPI0010738BBC|nr:hypothetical protein [Blastococcus sp. CT_GayMR20]TFV91013.1 hypothetical protein E4P40_06200 [Blastococcus sp. CT_GayMR20]